MNRLKAELWVEALIRRAELGFASAYVIRRGDENAGSVLVKVVSSTGLASLFVPTWDEKGDRIWAQFRSKPVSEREIDDYCGKRVNDDPDLWVIEIEDRQGRHFLTEPVENS